MKRIGQHAVVIGASMGGLLAARVLADYYDAVTVVERDAFPAVGESRKGVPQGRHAHGLHARGREVIEQLFPGFTQEMAAQGGIVLDISREFRWFANGGFHQPTTSGLEGLIVSRPRLEGGVRTRLLALPNVTAIENCDVPGLVTSEDRTRVTGVRLVRRANGDGETEETLAADLVVDATGRGSRTPAWLAELGYEQPQEDRVRIDMGYTTRLYRRTPEQLAGTGGLAIAGAPPDGRNGVVLAQEGDRWIVTLGGFNGDFAPLDPQGFLDFAARLPTPVIYNLIKDAEPLSEPFPYRFPANQRRRYERLTRFPDGYLVFGDAICSFNPVYGQGMTVAANEAIVLQECLAQGGANLARRFFKGVSPVVDAPWSVAVGNDLQLPHVEWPRTRMDRFINWYIGKLHIAARNDGALSIAFLRVVNMIAPATSLLHPRMAWRILRGNLNADRVKPAAAPAVVTAPLEG
jgi:2-polyprenyl-6-methoxyphenol hydroxylase-like FAD-dependent oxidoreductase